MADPFATALAVQFKAAGSVAADYHRLADASVTAVRTLRYEREAGQLVGPGNVNRVLTYEIRFGDLANRPASGDTIAEPRGTYRIAQVEDIGDIADGVWLCTVAGPL